MWQCFTCWCWIILMNGYFLSLKGVVIVEFSSYMTTQKAFPPLPSPCFNIVAISLKVKLSFVINFCNEKMSFTTNGRNILTFPIIPTTNLKNHNPPSHFLQFTFPKSLISIIPCHSPFQLLSRAPNFCNYINIIEFWIFLSLCGKYLHFKPQRFMRPKMMDVANLVGITISSSTRIHYVQSKPNQSQFLHCNHNGFGEVTFCIFYEMH